MQNEFGPRQSGAQPGNDNAIRTGLYVRAPKGISQRSRQVEILARKMRLLMPWLEDADTPACRAWAEFEILAQRVHAELRKNGVINAEGEGRRLLDDYTKLRRAQLQYAMALGMTPAGRMQIKAGATDAALDLVSLMQGVEPEAARPNLRVSPRAKRSNRAFEHFVECTFYVAIRCVRQR